MNKKQIGQNIWQHLLKVWAVVMITIIVLRVTDKDVLLNVDFGFWSAFAPVIAVVTGIIKTWIDSRKPK